MKTSGPFRMARSAMWRHSRSRIVKESGGELEAGKRPGGEGLAGRVGTSGNVDRWTK